ncbi:TetR/AcrR family transcriptional regulator [Sphingomonas sp. BLCC-B65]|nr:TetR/AcrR family transcriptional regulator [Sphingomonas sp. BLCC-B65]
MLALAEQVLRRGGVASLSLRELAREAGVSPAAPSRHFTSKQALLDALALSGYERLADAISASQEDADAAYGSRLAAAARAYVAFAVENAALLDLMFSVKRESDLSEEQRAGVRRWSDQLLELIDSGQRAGEVREGSREAIALPVMSALHGYASLAAKGLLPTEAAAGDLDELIAFILRGSAV